jgi:hypothetical protein
MSSALAFLVFAAAWVLLALDVDPVPTWFYVFAWYPILVIADAYARKVSGGPSLFRPLPRLLSLFGWSALVWLVFEAANFRLRNWYYVFLPAHPVERWAGILISFATVVPAIVLAERLLCALGVGRHWQSAPLTLRAGHLPTIQVVGVSLAVLALLFPRTFFPLIWGAVWLIADPIVFRRKPEWSLMADATAGTWGRIGRLMLGGLAVGLIWEFLNFWARGKWIYTVPWLEYSKVFEMPHLGFLGFPFFALEAWAMYHVLCLWGVGAQGGRDEH